MLEKSCPHKGMLRLCLVHLAPRRGTPRNPRQLRSWIRSELRARRMRARCAPNLPSQVELGQLSRAVSPGRVRPVDRTQKAQQSEG